ncbi:MAG TPA: lipopolysaccharide biosynthesis protein [Gaiellaceae bacterium]|nr:lipopolysaccharide biosynthesis protein [Gaiellaceae bacterium]
MRSLLVRRSLTAVGIYASVVLGFLGTVVGTKELDTVAEWGAFAFVIYATSFLQSFFDLTVEEAAVKYGFRYITREDWGRLRRLFEGVLGVKLAGSLLGALALVVFSQFASSSLERPLLLAAGIPLVQSLEGLGGTMLYLRSRYDLRSLLLAWGMGLRLLGIAVGARHGVSEMVAGVLAAQVVSTLTVVAVGLAGFRRFPRHASEPLGADRREIVSFIAQSSVATGVISLRGGLAPLLLGAVAGKVQVGLLRVAQAPQSGFAALSAPARMVLLTEQTREWEKGRQSAVLRDVRRYSVVAFVASLVVVPPLYYWMPNLISFFTKPEYVAATTAARIFVISAAVQLVVGWTKSFPVTIGRPGLRVRTHGIETAVVLPLVPILGAVWGVSGAAAAMLAGSCVFAVAWFYLFVRIRPDDSLAPVVETGTVLP